MAFKWDENSTAAAVEAYEASGKDNSKLEEIAEALVEGTDKVAPTKRAVISKLAHEGVYQKDEKKASSEPKPEVVSKKEMISRLRETYGVDNSVENKYFEGASAPFLAMICKDKGIALDEETGKSYPEF